VIGARRDEGASWDDVTEEQRRHGPKMGLPVGPGRFWAAPASLILPYSRYARSSLLGSLQNRLGPWYWVFRDGPLVLGTPL